MELSKIFKSYIGIEQLEDGRYRVIKTRQIVQKHELDDCEGVIVIYFDKFDIEYTSPEELFKLFCDILLHTLKKHGKEKSKSDSKQRAEFRSYCLERRISFSTGNKNMDLLAYMVNSIGEIFLQLEQGERSTLVFVLECLIDLENHDEAAKLMFLLFEASASYPNIAAFEKALERSNRYMFHLSSEEFNRKLTSKTLAKLFLLSVQGISVAELQKLVADGPETVDEQFPDFVTLDERDIHIPPPLKQKPKVKGEQKAKKAKKAKAPKTEPVGKASEAKAEAKPKKQRRRPVWLKLPRSLKPRKNNSDLEARRQELMDKIGA